MIDNNGFLFEFGDIENLKKVLIEINNLSEEENQKMSIMSRRMFEFNWTMESVYSKWNKILIEYDSFSA